MQLFLLVLIPAPAMDELGPAQPQLVVTFVFWWFVFWSFVFRHVCILYFLHFFMFVFWRCILSCLYHGTFVFWLTPPAFFFLQGVTKHTFTIYLLNNRLSHLNPTKVGSWVGFSFTSSSTRPASQRSTFKPQFTIIVKIKCVSSVINSQKLLTLDLFPSNLPIHQTKNRFIS